MPDFNGPIVLNDTVLGPVPAPANNGEFATIQLVDMGATFANGANWIGVNIALPGEVQTPTTPRLAFGIQEGNLVVWLFHPDGEKHVDAIFEPDAIKIANGLSTVFVNAFDQVFITPE